MILSQISPVLSLDLSGPAHSVMFPFQLGPLSGRILACHTSSLIGPPRLTLSPETIAQGLAPPPQWDTPGLIPPP